ncbi:hypothetical protein ACFQ23_13985 [Schaalia naturae]|jgi:hypothetical protein|uniref:Uncharacterized protein n=1 Tax=Schaalia naturae TaxID=635203 RepID=A0ABW2SL69_9ACTO
MSEGIAVIALTTIVLVALAIAVVVAVAVSRRPASSWQERLREQTALLRDPEPDAEPPARVTPSETTLSDLLATDEHGGNAYVDPRAIPGFDRLESVAQTVRAGERQSSRRG